MLGHDARQIVVRSNNVEDDLIGCASLDNAGERGIGHGAIRQHVPNETEKR